MFAFKTDITWIDRRGRAETTTASEFEKLCCQYAKSWSAIPSNEACILWEPSINAYAVFVGAMLAGKTPSFFSVPTFKLDKEYFKNQLSRLREQGIYIVGSNNYKDLHLETIEPNTNDSLELDTIPSSAQSFAQYSSGTTGLRKKIFYTEEDLSRHNLEYANCLNLGEKETIVSWLPHYHDMGLIACLLMPLQLGYNLVCMSNLSWISKPDLLLQGIEDYSGTLCWQPNFAYQVLTDRCEQRNLSSTRFISCAEPVMESTSRNFEDKFNSQVTGCYAMAENVFAVTQSNTDETFQGVRGSGKVFGSNEVKVVEGEIVIRSDYLFKHYESGEDNRQKDGWYYTGDHGEIIDGELFILGRMDDAFKVHGVKIIPELIEAEVNQIKGIKPGRVACIEKRDGTQSTAILLYEGSVERKELLPYISRYGVEDCVQVPTNWLVKSSSGKISRKVCRGKFEELSKELV